VKSAPKSAMVLAAGLGKRLRPLTDVRPKPLIEVAGQPLIAHALDRLALAGVERAVVNLYYKPEMIEAALAGRTRPRIELSREPELLETGGGVKNALPLLGDIFCVERRRILAGWLDLGANAPCPIFRSTANGCATANAANGVGDRL